MRNKYATVKIPIELVKTLDEICEQRGYRRGAEIVNDAIRRFLDFYGPLTDSNCINEEKRVVLNPAH